MKEKIQFSITIGTGCRKKFKKKTPGAKPNLALSVYFPKTFQYKCLAGSQTGHCERNKKIQRFVVLCRIKFFLSKRKKYLNSVTPGIYNFFGQIAVFDSKKIGETRARKKLKVRGIQL